MTRIGIVGAAGRMGLHLIQAVTAAAEATLAAAVEYPGHPELGQDAALRAGCPAAGVPLTESLSEAARACDVLIDFSAPDTLPRTAAAAAEAGCALVVGTTGLGAAQLELLRTTAARIPVVQSANYSIGVNILLDLVRKTAALLGDDFDIEITEAHHRHKKDAPSGTALALRNAVTDTLGRDPETETRHGRQGITGERTRTEIGMHAIRGGDVVGDHTVGFYGEGERIELTHKASSRMTFARGALRAALWTSGKAPGLYAMRDVLEL